MTISGGCRCGAVRYDLAMDDLPVSFACHCLDCQTWSGSAFASNALLPDSVLTFHAEPFRFELDGRDGRRFEQLACRTCMTVLANRTPDLPKMTILRVGTLDRSNEIVPAVHMWTSRKQSWVRIPEAIPAFETTPTPQQFAAVLGRVPSPSVATWASE
ncbi:GFA family protein [Sphingomonas sp.]|uniref:GFA family protein n=1 Tax=Sphingomonas sp. TaxID=28214 RepID=UPI0035C85EC3